MKKIIIEDYGDNPKKFFEIIIPKGYRLLNINEAVEFSNSKKFKVNKDVWRQFFFEQPFKTNKKLGLKVAALFYYWDGNWLDVGSGDLGSGAGSYAFGVFIKK